MSFVVPERERWALPPLLRERAAELGERPFLSFGVDDATATYAEVDERTRPARRRARRPGRRAGRPGAPHAAQPARVRARLVRARHGSAPSQVPVNVDYRGRVPRAPGEHGGGARSWCVEDDLIDAVAGSLDRLEHLRTRVVVGSGEAPRRGRRCALRRAARGRPPAEVAPPRPTSAAIHFTSGTSGPSKGAVLPHAQPPPAGRAQPGAARHRSRRHLPDRAAAVPHQRPDERVQHAAGRRRARARVSILGQRWLDRVRASGATHTSLLGVMLAFILKQPPSAGRRRHCAASVWTVPCVPRPGRALSRPVRGRAARDLLRQHRGRHGRPPAPSTRRRVRSGRVEPSCTTSGSSTSSTRRCPPASSASCWSARGCPGRRRSATSGCPTGRSRLQEPVVPHRRCGPARRPTATCGSSTGSRTASDAGARTSRRSTSRSVLLEHAAIADAAVVAVPADEEGGEDEIKAVLVAAPR